MQEHRDEATPTPTPVKEDKIKITKEHMKDLRYKEWMRTHKWDEDDLDRILDSRDALPEMIQDYETQMVVVGTDIISLYPNMEVRRVVMNMKEAVRISKMEFRNVDYMECVRYIALNWDAETCRKSILRRVLPVRRGTRGSRPGMKGQGPRGKVKNDQEQ